MKLEGRVWPIKSNGEFIDDIDTDMIFHNSYLHITDRDQMGKYAFGNLKSWEDFPTKAKTGDILIVGDNFGCGSSRQHAVDCFITLGIQAIIGKSFGSIYLRNAINSGLAVLEWPDIQPSLFNNEDILSVDLETGNVQKDKNILGKCIPMNPIQLDIYKAGDLFSYAKLI